MRKVFPTVDGVILVDNINNKLSHFPAANGIRGLAVLIVLLAHSVGMFFPAIGATIPGTGKIGVWLFFSLSAFLLTNNFIQKGFSLNQITSYVLGRVLRIIPLYLIAIYTYYYFGYFDLKYAESLIWMNTPWGHLWTVAVEFKFYFLLPFIALLLVLINKVSGSKGVILSSIALVIIHQLFFPFYNVKPSSTNVNDYISSFIPGMAVAIMLSNGLKLSSPTRTLASMTLLIGITVSIPAIRQAVFNIPVDEYLLNKHFHFSLAWAAFILLAVTGEGYLGRFLKSKFLSLLGKWSFSIYLFHWLIYTQLIVNHKESVLFSMAGPLMAVAVGMVVYSFVEKPLEILRHHIMHKIA